MNTSGKFILKNTRAIFWAVLITLLMTTYWRIILTGSVLQYDDQVLYGAIKSIDVFIHYFDYLKNGKILDVQPIRDLSYLFDYKLSQIFSWYGPHITNLIIWIGIIYIIRLLLFKMTQNKWVINLLALFYAFSPVNTSTVAWISGRKHLLSTFFVLWAAYIFNSFILNKKQSIKSILLIGTLFLFSGLSQPINCLFPIWIFLSIYLIEINQQNKSIFEVFKKKEYIVLLSLIGIISFLIIIINLLYYNSFYLVAARGLSKYVAEVENPFGITFLAIGRYFFLSLFPFNALPTSHYVGSIENLIGLILLPLILYLSFKLLTKNKTHLYYISIAYFFIPLIPVTFKMTNIFCSDTYLLNSGIGILMLIALVSTIPKFEKIFFIIFIPYTVFIIYFNFQYTNVFQSDFNIWDYSYHQEATPTNTANLALQYSMAGRYIDAETLLNRIEIWNPDLLFLGKIKADNYFRNSQINLEDKILKLSAIKFDSPTKYFYLSELYAQKKEIEMVNKNISLIFKNKKMFSVEMIPIKEQLIAYCISTCEYFKQDNCNEKYLKYKADPTFSNWNQAAFDSSYKIFQNNHNFNFLF